MFLVEWVEGATLYVWEDLCQVSLKERCWLFNHHGWQVIVQWVCGVGVRFYPKIFF